MRPYLIDTNFHAFPEVIHPVEWVPMPSTIGRLSSQIAWPYEL